MWSGRAGGNTEFVDTADSVGVVGAVGHVRERVFTRTRLTSCAGVEAGEEGGHLGAADLALGVVCGRGRAGGNTEFVDTADSVGVVGAVGHVRERVFTRTRLTSQGQGSIVADVGRNGLDCAEDADSKGYSANEN